MINKKGILLGNTLKTILAVMVLLLLFVGAWLVYSAVTKDNELELVRKTLGKIEAKASALKQNETTTMTLQGFDSKENWYIVGWGKQDFDAPEKCSLSSCVCICSSGYQAPQCQARSECIDVEEQSINVTSIDSVKKSNPSDKGKITYEVNERVNYILIPQNFAELKIEKNTDSEGNTFLKIQDD